jgi:drug/metabolite transporter (DMT)-like permease
MLGVAVLGIDTSRGIHIGRGEALTALSAVIFAVFILFLDHAGKQVRGSHLALGLIAGAGLPMLPLSMAVSAAGDGIGAWFDWLQVVLSDRVMIRDVVLLTILSTVVATHLMGTYQPRVSASRAALIYLLEPVFAATISVIIGYDVVTWRLLLGGLLILGGNALPEVPKWLRRGNGV